MMGVGVEACEMFLFNILEVCGQMMPCRVDPRAGQEFLVFTSRLVTFWLGGYLSTACSRISYWEFQDYTLKLF